MMEAQQGMADGECQRSIAAVAHHIVRIRRIVPELHGDGKMALIVWKLSLTAEEVKATVSILSGH